MAPNAIRRAALVVLVIALIPGNGVRALAQETGRAQLSPAARDSITRAIEQDRRQTAEWLKASPTSYLAAIRRVDFGGRQSLTIGRDRGNDVIIDDPEVLPHHLRVTVAGDSFIVATVDDGAAFAVEKTSRKHAVLPPSSIGIGRYTLRLSHQRYPAVIVFDPASPRFKEFKGLSYFPVDLHYRFVLPLEPNEKQDTTVILSSRGNRRKALRVGWFSFGIGETRCRLEASRLLEPGVDEKSFSIFFRDETCGNESYGMGRYVEVEELGGDLYLLDFNTAYNPACAFSPHYNCPIPPAQNSLPVRIPAGEMDSHYVEH
jgi:uncharacterized protein (DUF1684 family)